MAKTLTTIRCIGKEICGPAVLVALVVGILHRSLFSGGRLAPAYQNSDFYLVYMPWRYFGFTQWKLGHFPFWNPHVFCGLPFFAQIQMCLLYPVSWIHFLFSTGSAATLEMAINLAIGLICTYAWARQRKISPCGATLAGAVFTFSGTLYPYVLDGYLSVLASAAWMPLIFLAFDRLIDKKFRSSVLIGSVAICMQCLGAQPQLVYYTLFIGGLYVLLQSIGEQQRLRVCGGFIAMWVLGGTLAAIQLLPTQLATQLSVRAGGVSYDFASLVSLPPENLLSMFVPYPLGNIVTVPYVGRWFLWEMSVYIGLVALVLAGVNLVGIERKRRWGIIALLGIILVLSLGMHTPMHWILYKYLPGYGLFRAPTKFRILWALLLAIMAGEGWDRIRGGRIPRWTVLVTATGAGICILLTAVMYHFDSANGPVPALLRFIFRTSEYGALPKDFPAADIVQSMQHWVVRQWSVAAGLLAMTSLLIYLCGRFPRAAYFLLVLAIADVFAAAVDCSVTSPLQLPFPQEWANAVKDATAHDQRVLFTREVADVDLGDTLGFNSIWGYDSGQPKRFTELFAASQDVHPAAADLYSFQVSRISRVFQLFRCRYILQRSRKYPVLTLHDPVPRMVLIGNYALGKNAIVIADQLAKDFDFHHSVILENEPTPCPTITGAAGQVTLVRQSINDMEIDADLPAPALLVITDSYAPGWRVTPIEQNPNQSEYEVLPADDVMRAIPLAAGHHHFDLYYIAPGFKAGIGISIAGFIVWIALCITGKQRRHEAGPLVTN